MRHFYPRAFFSRLLPALLLLLSFSYGSFAQTDTTVGIHTPKGEAGSYKKLTHALCDSLTGDRQKANAIYNWITHHIRYDVKAMQQGRLKEEKPEKVFKQRKGMCAGYSLLFAAMCNEAGLKAVMVDGYAKDWMFDDGDKLYIPRHAWNAVYIDKKWQLVDATWGAGGLSQAPGWLKQQMSKAAKDPSQASGKLRFRYHYDTTCFLADPLVFRIRHLPSDPLWQLTDTCMPLQVFEAGEIAIRNFNARYHILVENLPELDQMAGMDERTRVQASAERISRYNPRFHVIMAAKHQADAVDTIAAHRASGAAGNVLSTIQRSLKNAEQEVNAQKGTITAEYAQLKTKNKTKSRLAQQYIRSIHSDNKRMIAQCESRVRNVTTRAAAIREKAVTAARSDRNTDAGKLAAVKTSAQQEPAASQVLRTLEDSVQKRNLRIAALKGDIARQQAFVKILREVNGNRLDTLAAIFQLADSALTEETIARIRMHDNYDEEVLQWNRIVKTTRLQQVDSIQKYYFAGYDSVARNYEALRKLQWSQLKLYKKNFKDIEQYKRRNSGNTALFAQYPAQMQEHDTCMAAYYHTLSSYAGYIQGNKKLFDQLVKLYKRQETLAGYMEKSENKRKELEEKNLAEKEAFDKKENEKQKEQLKQTGRKAEKLLARK